MNLGMLRIKNEARWIKRCLESLLPVCDRLLVMDDNSTDETAEIATSVERTDVFRSPFEGLNESRDKSYLLELAMKSKPEWIISTDGDEMLDPRSVPVLLDLMAKPHVSCISPRIKYLWNSESEWRTDGIYGRFHRESMFRPSGAQFRSTGHGGNFHCGNVPLQDRQKRIVRDDVVLLHFGYLDREIRERKLAWYRSIDPNNATEDNYSHIAIGDSLPANTRTMYAGPLRLQTL